MKRFPVIILSFSSLLLWQCGMQTDVASNYYDDGIYFDPAYGDLLVSTESEEPESTYSTVEEDYYTPGQYTSPYETNDYYSNSYYSNSSPWGWNSGLFITFGTFWGYPTMYSDYYGGYPYYGYGGYPYFGYGGYNPYCPGYGGYPYYGYGYGGYPYYGYGGYPGGGYYPNNDFGNYWNNGNHPDVIERGNGGPRGGRNNSGSTVTTTSNGTPLKDGRVTNSSSTAQNGYSAVSTKSEKTSMLRQASVTKPKTQYTNTYTRAETSLYQKATGNPVIKNNNVRNGSGYTATPRTTSTTKSSTSTLVRQTNRIMTPQSNSNNRSNAGSGVRSAVNRGATMMRSTNRSSENVRSSGSSGGGNVRSSGGGGTRSTSGGSTRSSGTRK